jgi:hypothetical protein
LKRRITKGKKKKKREKKIKKRRGEDALERGDAFGEGRAGIFFFPPCHPFLDAKYSK